MARMKMAEILFEDESGGIVALVPDTVVTEGPHRVGNVATEQEVEAGLHVTDHVRAEADELTLEVVFSNTPIRDIVPSEPTHFAFTAQPALGPMDLDLPRGLAVSRYSSRDRGPEIEERDQGSARAQVLQVDEPVTRVEDSWGLILDARDRAWLAIVVTDIRTYDDMILVSAETTRTAADGTWIRVLLTFRQIRQVATELVDVAVPLRPRNRRGDNNTAGTKPANEADTAAVRSLAVQAGLGNTATRAGEFVGGLL